MKKRLILLALCVAWSEIASAAIYFYSSQMDNSFINGLNWNGPVGGTGGEAVIIFIQQPVSVGLHSGL